jgi:hypothetical protein
MAKLAAVRCVTILPCVLHGNQQLRGGGEVEPNTAVQEQKGSSSSASVFQDYYR